MSTDNLFSNYINLIIDTIILLQKILNWILHDANHISSLYACIVIQLANSQGNL